MLAGLLAVLAGDISQGSYKVTLYTKNLKIILFPLWTVILAVFGGKLILDA